MAKTVWHAKPSQIRSLLTCLLSEAVLILSAEGSKNYLTWVALLLLSVVFRNSKILLGTTLSQLRRPRSCSPSSPSENVSI